MARLDTVNVIEICGEGGPTQCFSFTDDAEGKAQAEAAFLDLLRENKVEADETKDQDYLNEGKYDDGAGYLIYLVNSTA